MTLTRRDLLSKGALLVASGLVAPSFITRTALALSQSTTSANRVLVVVQLSGGNDGLNTVVPYGFPEYYKLRSTLAVPAGDVLPIADRIGLHPNLAEMKSLFDQGSLAIVEGVGYPNPNRSHFRSMDIWQSARPDAFDRSGWLGRYVDACQCSQDRSVPVPAVSVGDRLNAMFWTDSTLVPSVASIGAFTFRTRTNYRNDRQVQLQTLQNIYAQAGNWPTYESLIRKATLTALAGSDQLQAAAASYHSPVVYPPGNPLANQLQIVAQIIAGNVGARLFSVQMGGFDTHSDQHGQHETLVAQTSAAIAAFEQDMVALNRHDDVVLVTFSEFGRRPLENGSLGTDHGTAEPMFIAGGRVQGGLYGTYPSLSDLDDNGDLKFTTDFRSVYAGLLRDHMGIDPQPVLAGEFEPLSVLPSVAAA